MKIDRIRIINGDDDDTFDNTEAAKDVIYDLVTSNESITFQSSAVVDGLLTLEVL